MIGKNGACVVCERNECVTVSVTKYSYTEMPIIDPQFNIDLIGVHIYTLQSQSPSQKPPHQHGSTTMSVLTSKANPHLIQSPLAPTVAKHRQPSQLQGHTHAH